MGKELTIYKNTKVTGKKSKIAKGDIFKKASRQQKFLGKTLPRTLWGAAKWAWRNPLTATGAWIGGELAVKSFKASQKHLKFPKHRQFDKRARKFTL